MITRNYYLEQIQSLFQTFSVVAILGARQVGKSTLAKRYLEEYNQPYYFYDLESDRDRTALNNAQFALEQHSGLIVIDEIQRLANLFPLLRYLVDHRDQKYLILGSASRDLLNQSSETLAGRIAYIELPSLSFHETGLSLEQHLLRGGFPKSLLNNSESGSQRWRQEYIKTFLERDLQQLGFNIPAATMRRFWQILAHYHGQIFNASEIGSALNINLKTAQRYLAALEGSFMIYELKPWFENIKKRQVKRPKSYFSDTGLLNTLLGINSVDDMLAHPKLGGIWEGFALNEIIHRNHFEKEDCYFWATSNYAELDLFVIHQGKRLGYEFKFSDIPHITKSMRIACEDLKLDKLFVVVPKGQKYQLDDKIYVEPLTQ